MVLDNYTSVSEFILLAFTDSPQLLPTIFLVFLIIYVLSITGNLGMIMLIRIDPRLHTPMYFFLSNLSFIDICCSTNIVPKALESFLSEKKAISFAGCFVQMYVFIALGCTQCLLLGLMAYDHYVAICNPLRYMTIMSYRLCLKMAVGAYAVSFLNSIIHTTLISHLSFCHSNVINHFFCDTSPLLKLSCSDTNFSENLIFISATVTALGSCPLILISYTYILLTILRIRSADGRQKAFNTCASHLTDISIFYGTSIFVYLQPSSNYTDRQNKVASVFYTLVIPMLNPLIYSLRNKEMKDALKRAMGKKNIFSHPVTNTVLLIKS